MRGEKTMLAAGERPKFLSFLDAWLWWSHCVDRAPLKAMTTPPANATGDEVADAMLAVFFRHACEYDTPQSAIHYLTVCTTTWRQTADAVAAAGTQEEAARLYAMVAALRGWANEIFESLPLPMETA